MDKIKVITVITNCANFENGGVLCFNNELTSMPLEEVLNKIENGLENSYNIIKIPHKNNKGYMRIIPKFIVGYDVFYE